jgi:aerobic carbon-monoxide dehydrogenase large subunit
MGESGIVAGPAAVVNAVADALAPFNPGITQLPLTPERIWRLAANDIVR